MYKILIDTSSNLLNVGLVKENSLLEGLSYECWQRQSENLVPEIDKLLKKFNVTYSDIDGVAVGVGPGSYTGVRIGLTVAKTLAYATKSKLYGVSSLALYRIDDKPTICLMNARSGRSYFAVYLNSKVLEKEQILENESVLQYIKDHKDYLVSGDTAYLGIECEKFDMVHQLHNALIEENIVENPLALNPIYLKDL